MTTFPKGVCPGCRQLRQITADGFLRRHNKPGSTATCSGAGREPLSGAPEPAPTPVPPGTRLNAPAPTEPTWGRSCDGGGCDAESVGWRLFRGEREWLPVCGLHIGPAPVRARVYDRDLDEADGVAGPATQVSEPILRSKP